MSWLRSFTQRREPTQVIQRKNKYVLPPEVLPKVLTGSIDIGEQAAAHMKMMGFEIDPQSILGRGSYGKVYRASLAGAPMACKVLDLSSTLNIKRLVPRELDILRSELFHENIVTIYAAFEPPEDRLVDGNHIDKVYIFMELMSTDLAEHVEANDGLNDEEARFLFKQIAAGLEYLHSQDIAHRDVKPENVLLNEDRTVAKLTDFGLSVRVGINPRTGKRVRSITVTGTAYVIAPEVHYHSGEPTRRLYDAHLADVFSLGVTLFVMFENRTPFSEGISDHLLLQEKMNRQYVYKKHSSPMARSLIDLLMTPNERDRPTVTQALEHPWIASALNVVSGRPSPKAVRSALTGGGPTSIVRPQQDRVSRVRADSLGRSTEVNLPIPDFADLVLGPRLARSRSSSSHAPPPPPFVPTASIGIKLRDATQRAAADIWDTPPAAATRGAGFVNPFQDSDRLRRSSSSVSRQGPGGSRVRPLGRRSRAEEMGFSHNFPGARTYRDTRDEDSDDDFMF